MYGRDVGPDFSGMGENNEESPRTTTAFLFGPHWRTSYFQVFTGWQGLLLLNLVGCGSVGVYTHFQVGSRCLDEWVGCRLVATCSLESTPVLTSRLGIWTLVIIWTLRWIKTLRNKTSYRFTILPEDLRFEIDFIYQDQTQEGPSIIHSTTPSPYPKRRRRYEDSTKSEFFLPSIEYDKNEMTIFFLYRSLQFKSLISSSIVCTYREQNFLRVFSVLDSSVFFYLRNQNRNGTYNRTRSLNKNHLFILILTDGRKEVSIILSLVYIIYIFTGHLRIHHVFILKKTCNMI